MTRPDTFNLIGQSKSTSVPTPIATILTTVQSDRSINMTDSADHSNK